MTSQTYPLNLGQTLSLGGTALLPSGSWTASAPVRNAAGSLMDTLPVTLTPLDSPTDTATHSVLIVGTSTQTALWNASLLTCEVRIADNSTPPVVLPPFKFFIDAEA